MTYCKHRIGHSVKGWTNGEIGVEWIKEFDRNTTRKANGRYCLLLVNSHNSHYTQGFLKYARAHKILVLCYPAHTTHVLQGLDVVIFAIVKRCLGDECEEWEWKTVEKMSKTNFIGIYGRAHEWALTPENIKSSFQATGVWPLDPSVITPAMMAVSKETSCEAHLPIAPTKPVQVIAKRLQKLAVAEDIVEQVMDGSGNESTDSADAGDEEVDGCLIGHDPKPALACKEGPTVSSPAAAINEAIKQLSEGSLVSLVSSSTITSSTAVHHNANQLVSPAKSHIPKALRTVPKTMDEIFLLGMLRESEAHAADLKSHVLELQAVNILNEAY